MFYILFTPQAAKNLTNAYLSPTWIKKEEVSEHKNYILKSLKCYIGTKMCKST